MYFLISFYSSYFYNSEIAYIPSQVLHWLEVEDHQRNAGNAANHWLGPHFYVLLHSFICVALGHHIHLSLQIVRAPEVDCQLKPFCKHTTRNANKHHSWVFLDWKKGSCSSMIICIDIMKGDITKEVIHIFISWLQMIEQWTFGRINQAQVFIMVGTGNDNEMKEIWANFACLFSIKLVNLSHQISYKNHIWSNMPPKFNRRKFMSQKLFVKLQSFD